MICLHNHIYPIIANPCVFLNNCASGCEYSAKDQDPSLIAVIMALSADDLIENEFITFFLLLGISFGAVVEATHAYI